MPYTRIPIVVVIWEKSNFEGKRIALAQDTPDISVYNIPLYDDADFHGNNASPETGVGCSVEIHKGPSYNSYANHRSRHGSVNDISFYSAPNYGGAQIVLTPGKYPSLGPFNFNHNIKSVRFTRSFRTESTIGPIPVVAELYKDTQFRGAKLLVVDNISNLHSYCDFGDKISSVRVFEGPDFSAGSALTLFQNAGYGGSRFPLEPGEYPDLRFPNNFNDIASSVKVRP